MAPDNFYDLQDKILEHSKDIEAQFGALIDGFLKEEYKSEMHEKYKSGLIAEAQNLDKDRFNVLLENVKEKMLKASGDDKKQLVELWATLSNNKPDYLRQSVETNGRIDFSIIGGKYGKYRVVSDNIRALGTDIYEVNIRTEKKDGKFLTYGRNLSFKMRYKPESGVIEYKDERGNTGKIVIDHKTETINKSSFLIGGKTYKRFEVRNKEYVGEVRGGKVVRNTIQRVREGRFIIGGVSHSITYERGAEVPIRLKINGRDLHLNIKFHN